MSAISANLTLDGVGISAEFLTGTTLNAAFQLDDLRVVARFEKQDPSTDEFALTARLQLDDLTVESTLVTESAPQIGMVANLVLDDLGVVAQLRTTQAPAGTYLNQAFENQTLLLELDYLENGEIKTAYFSNNGYTDDQAHRHYDGRIIEDPFITFGFDAPLTIGNLKLKNLDGQLDDFMTARIVQMQSVQLFEGDKFAPRSAFSLVFTGFAKSIRFDNENVTILLTDFKEFFNRDLQLNFYDKTTPELEGQPYPLLFGECFNVTPILIGADSYEFHAGTGTGTTEIKMRDNGAEFTAPIEFEPNTGSFIAGEKPAGAFTGDFIGSDDETGHSTKLTSIFKQICHEIDLSFEFDEPSFLKLQQDPRVGIYLTQKTNALQLLDDLLKSIRATWFFNEEGKIEIAQLQALTQSIQTVTTTQTIREEIAVQETESVEEGEVIFFEGSMRTGKYAFASDASLSNQNLADSGNSCIEFWVYGASELFSETESKLILGFVPNTQEIYGITAYSSDWTIATINNGEIVIYLGSENNLSASLFKTGNNKLILNAWNYVKISSKGMFLNGERNAYGNDFVGFNPAWDLKQDTSGFQLQVGGTWWYYNVGWHQSISNAKVKQIRITSSSARETEPNPPTTPLAPLPYIYEVVQNYTTWLPRTISTTETITTVFEPDGGEPDLVIESYSILEITLQTHDDYVVCNQVKVGVQKNWTVQDVASLAQILSEEEKRKYAREYFYTVIAKEESVSENYLMSGVKTLENSYFTSLSQAQIEAIALLNLYKQPRFLLKVKCTGYWVLNGAKTLRLGSAIKINSQRYGTKVGVITNFTHHFISGIYELEVLI